MPLFATTLWSVVLAAGDPSAPTAHEALERLCRIYWYPLYAYVRRTGRGVEDAEDLTQAFFAHLLTKGFPRGAVPDRGKFRSFLLVSLRHFLADYHRYTHSAKRGGGIALVPLDARKAEERFGLEPHDSQTPETLYEREWALALLDRARARLRQEFNAARSADLYDRLQVFPLTGKGECSFQQAAAKLGMTESALKSAVHRLRARYRELVREEVTHTVGDPSEVREEARHLIAVIGG
jgi:RNA polymerase sigma-70 factor (ECF subfamily)